MVTLQMVTLQILQSDWQSNLKYGSRNASARKKEPRTLERRTSSGSHKVQQLNTWQRHNERPRRSRQHENQTFHHSRKYAASTCLVLAMHCELSGNHYTHIATWNIYTHSCHLSACVCVYRIVRYMLLKPAIHTAGSYRYCVCIHIVNK